MTALAPLLSCLQSVFKEAIAESVNRAVDNAMKKYFDLCKPMENYTRQQACEALHISLPTFHAWVENGTLRPTKINGRIMVSKQDLEELIAERNVNTSRSLKEKMEIYKDPAPIDMVASDGIDPLEIKIEDVKQELSVRTYNCTRCLEIETLRDLARYTRSELLAVASIGPKTADELEEFLSLHGLCLGYII